MSNLKFRTKEEIRELERKDPFFTMRSVTTMNDYELYELFKVFTTDEWEKQNIEEYMANLEIQKLLEDK